MSIPLPRGARTILKLEPDGLYILLSEQELPQHWHWGLYLHKTQTEGMAFHITRPSDLYPWKYEARKIQNIIFSVSITVALKIAVVSGDMHEVLQDRLAQVAIEENERFGALTCRTWLLEAVAELDDEGYISIKPGATIEQIETEAFGVAKQNALIAETGQLLESEDKVHRSTYSIA